jgi:hypothetical protein
VKRNSFFKAGPEENRGNSSSNIYFRGFQDMKRFYRRKEGYSKMIGRKCMFSVWFLLPQVYLFFFSLAEHDIGFLISCSE